MPVPSSWVTGPMGQFIGGPTYDPPTYPVPQAGGGVGAPYGGAAGIDPWAQTRPPPSPGQRVLGGQQRGKDQAVSWMRQQFPGLPLSDDTLYQLYVDKTMGIISGQPSDPAGYQYLSGPQKGRAARIGAGIEAGAPPTMSPYQREMLGGSAADRAATAAWRTAQLGETALSREELGKYREQTLGQNWAQMAQARALEEAQIAAANERARLQQEQRQREMAAQVGQAIAAMQAEVWRQGMPFTLPQGTTYAPGFERGGPVSGLYAMGGSQYTPTPLAVTNPPSAEEMETWVRSAMQRFGP